MRVIQIIGQPGAGKTTLVVDLIEALTSKGLSVGSIKHTAHSYELDKPGKDSHRHRVAGASPAAMVNGAMAAVYLPREEGKDPMDTLLELYKGLDLVIIEGWISGPYPKFEVWRKATERAPISSSQAVVNVVGLVSDDEVKGDVPLFSRGNLKGLQTRILQMVEENSTEIVEK